VPTDSWRAATSVAATVSCSPRASTTGLRARSYRELPDASQSATIGRHDARAAVDPGGPSRLWRSRRRPECLVMRGGFLGHRLQRLPRKLWPARMIRYLIGVLSFRQGRMFRGNRRAGRAVTAECGAGGAGGTGEAFEPACHVTCVYEALRSVEAGHRPVGIVARCAQFQRTVLSAHGGSRSWLS
jgi:hypothetical protein